MQYQIDPRDPTPEMAKISFLAPFCINYANFAYLVSLLSTLITVST